MPQTFLCIIRNFLMKRRELFINMGQLDCILTIFTLLFSRYLTACSEVKPVLLSVSFGMGVL